MEVFNAQLMTKKLKIIKELRFENLYFNRRKLDINKYPISEGNDEFLFSKSTS